MYSGNETNVHVIPPLSCSSRVYYSNHPPINLGMSLELLWAVWGQFSVRYSLVPACTCSQICNLFFSPLNVQCQISSRILFIFQDK